MALIAMVAGLAGGPQAGAQVDGAGSEGLISADLSTVGVRAITLVDPLTLSGALSSGLTDSYGVTVTETTRTGTNAWSVSGRICGPNNYTVPTASDCTTHPDELALDADSTIPASAIGVASQTVTQTLGGGTSTAGSAANLASAITLFSNAGQLTTTVYSGTYAAAGDLTLTPPHGTETGNYRGYFVVTLTQ